jgi:hypothetical protein
VRLRADRNAYADQDPNAGPGLDRDPIPDAGPANGDRNRNCNTDVDGNADTNSYADIDPNA